MSTTRVNHIEHYDNADGEFCITKGKLYLIFERQVIPNPGNLSYVYSRTDYLSSIQFATCKSDVFRLIRPLIVSEIEEINSGDNYLFVKNNTICKADVSPENLKILQELQKTGFVFKILALPENFSQEMLQDIIDKKLKNNEIVYVECTQGKPCKGYCGTSVGNAYCINNCIDKIKLTNNFVTLIDIIENRWDDIFNHFDFKLWVDTEFVALKNGFSERENDSSPLYSHDQLKLRYLKENYNLPTKKDHLH